MKQSRSPEPESQQTRHAAVPANSVSSSQIFVDNRASTAALRQLQTAMVNSPQAIAQRKLKQLMESSPRLLAQHRILSGEPVQRTEDDELLQGKFTPLQRVEEEEPLQGEFATEPSVQREQQPTTAKPNNTGLPDNLKSGIESLSGLAMDSVRVHYNSSQPAQLNALAYAQGTDIYLAPGQEQHLPHEAWHVVQQAQGRVQPTMQMKNGVPVNDNQGLEHEADVMGAKAIAGAHQRSRFDNVSFRMHASKVNADQTAQLEPFKFNNKDFDTNNPTPIWELAKSYFDAYDEKSYFELRDEVAKYNSELANEMTDMWESAVNDDEEYEEEEYEEEYAEFTDQSASSRKETRASDKREVGESKRSGSKSQRDKWYGDFANNPEAQEWWHRIGKKKNGGKDMIDAKTARTYFEDFKKYQNKQ